MSTKCPSCGEESLSWEDYDGQVSDTSGQRVCTECGYVQEDSCLRSDTYVPNAAHSDEYRAFARTLPEKYVQKNVENTDTRGKTSSFKSLKEIAPKFGMSPSMINEAKVLLEKSFANGDIIYHRAALQKKLTLACVCCFIVSRKEKIPVSLTFAANLTDSKVGEFNHLKNEVLKAFDIQLDEIGISEHIEYVRQQTGLDKVIGQTAFEIQEMCKDLWLSEGRNSQSLIPVTFHLAWQAQEPGERHSVDLNTFCDKYGVTMPAASKVRRKEVVNVLTALAAQIPWLKRVKISFKTLLFHLDDLIKYKKTLIAETASVFCGGVTTQPPCNNTGTSKSDTIATFENTFCALANIQYPGKRKASVGTNDTVEIPYKSSKTDINVVDGKFVPPSYRTNRKNSQETNHTEKEEIVCHYDLSCKELGGEGDIADSEIEEYLLTPKEIAMRKCIRDMSKQNNI